MKHIAIICAATLALSLLAGCMPAIVVTSPKDEAFQDAWDEAMDEVQTDLEDAWDKVQSSWESGGCFSDEKDHRWRVLDAEGQELYTVTEEALVKALDNLLSGGDAWKRLAKKPGDPAYSYVYSQEKTLLAGQDPSGEREYEDLMTFTISASEDVVTMQILGGLEELSLLPGVDLEDVLTFSASVPPDTAEALREPEQFT